MLTGILVAITTFAYYEWSLFVPVLVHVVPGFPLSTSSPPHLRVIAQQTNVGRTTIPGNHHANDVVHVDIVDSGELVL